jgi:hypothetical protein
MRPARRRATRAIAMRAPPIRFLVLGFGMLACVKVWTQDRMVRAAMSEALIQAYRERAQQVCGLESAKTDLVRRAAVKGSSAGSENPWVTSTADEVTIGSKLTSVMLWDYKNPMWDVRYRHPHLVLTAHGPRKMRCSYDLSVGVALVQGL